MKPTLPDFTSLLLYCRPGFEKEAAAEIQQHLLDRGVAGFCRTEPDSGLLFFQATEPRTLPLGRAIPRYNELIFARQLLFVLGEDDQLPPTDRVSPLMAIAKSAGIQFSDVWLETADTNEAKELSTLCRKLTSPFVQAMAKQALRAAPDNASAPRLHLLLRSGTSAVVALSLPGNRSEAPQGIVRLRMPGNAPSRSTLKLAEALMCFLTPEERERRLQPGMRAVDLGAAPGGWTWQLVQRHLQVIAVDNGPIDRGLLDSGLVTHRREDAFRFRPPKPVHWLVCDVVEQPIRIARLMAQWLAEGQATEAIFNLKLPMKKRFAEVERCFAAIDHDLEEAGVRYVLQAKQLYHDREEITCHLRRLDSPKSR